jgi:hypothetical protein
LAKWSSSICLSSDTFGTRLLIFNFFAFPIFVIQYDTLIFFLDLWHNVRAYNTNACEIYVTLTAIPHHTHMTTTMSSTRLTSQFTEITDGLWLAVVLPTLKIKYLSVANNAVTMDHSEYSWLGTMLQKGRFRAHSLQHAFNLLSLFHQSSSNDFQWQTYPLLWVPELSPCLSHSNYPLTNHTIF